MAVFVAASGSPSCRGGRDMICCRFAVASIAGSTARSTEEGSDETRSPSPLF